MIVEPRVDEVVVDPGALPAPIAAAPPPPAREADPLVAAMPLASLEMGELERAFQHAARLLDDPAQFEAVARALLAGLPSRSDSSNSAS